MADHEKIGLDNLTKDGKFPPNLLNAYRRAGFTGAGGLARTRGPFAAYLMSEKGFEYDDVKNLLNGKSNLNADEKQALIDGFVKELEDHPILKGTGAESGLVPEAEENAAMYGRWFKNAVEKMNSISFPSSDELGTPEKLKEFFNDKIYNTVVMDMAQEFELQWRIPGIGGVIQNETGEDAMYQFSCHESCAKAMDNIRIIVNEGGKSAVFNHPGIEDFKNNIAGKKAVDVDPVSNNLNVITGLMVHSVTIGMINGVAPSPAENEYMKTGKLPEGAAPVIGGQNYEQWKGMFTQDVTNTVAGLLNDYKGYDKRLKQDGVQKLIDKLPENLSYDPAAPAEDVKAVHSLYANTVGHLWNSTTVQANHAMGKKLVDVIEIDGKSLKAIVDEKYADHGLSDEQKQTAMEYEFASAIGDKSRKLEFRPAKMDPITGIISQPENGTALMQGVNAKQAKRDEPVHEAPAQPGPAQPGPAEPGNFTFSITTFTKDGNIPARLEDAYHKAGFNGAVERARGPFFTYLLSEKGYTYEQAKDLFTGKSGLSADDKQKLVDDYVTALEAHPLLSSIKPDIPHPDADENACVYAKWFRDSAEKMKSVKFPDAGELKTPNAMKGFLKQGEFLKAVMMDLGQEYEKAFKSPGAGSVMMLEAGEEAFKTFNGIDLSMKAYGNFLPLMNMNPKFGAFIYPEMQKFFENVSGKSLADTDPVENAKVSGFTIQVLTSISSYQGKATKMGNLKLDSFMETGKIEGGPVTLPDIETGEDLTLEKFHERNDATIKNGVNRMLFGTGHGYEELLGKDRLEEYAGRLPDEIKYALDVPQEDIDAVHRLYTNTVGHLNSYTSAAMNAIAGKSMADLIYVDGRSLNDIVEEKFDGLDLDDDQKQTAAEFEFAAALIDRDKKLTHHPVTPDPVTGDLRPDPVGKNLPKCGRFPKLDGLYTVQDNFDNVQKAYFGHKNSKEYNKMLEYLDKAVKAPDREKYDDAREQLALRAVAYLEHTGYGKAKHEKSETRRQLAFQILYLTDPEKFDAAMKKANAVRDKEDRITPEKLQKMPGVGLPSPKRNKIDLKELTREEKESKNKKDAPKKRPEKSLNDAFIAEPPKKGKGKGKGK